MVSIVMSLVCFPTSHAEKFPFPSQAAGWFWCCVCECCEQDKFCVHGHAQIGAAVSHLWLDLCKDICDTSPVGLQPCLYPHGALLNCVALWAVFLKEHSWVYLYGGVCWFNVCSHISLRLCLLPVCLYVEGPWFNEKRMNFLNFDFSFLRHGLPM